MRHNKPEPGIVPFFRGHLRVIKSQPPVLPRPEVGTLEVEVVTDKDYRRPVIAEWR